MLFERKDELKVVSSCPVTKASSGVMEFPPELVAKIAGAVRDKIEWMVLLLGERSEDGFEVKVTDFRVPSQRRTSGDVSMTEPMEGDGSTVDDKVVGVLHSHHSMGAFFSHTDNTELNPFFKSSIVVAQAGKSALGFNYKAEGKVVLPCGSVGKVPFYLNVTGSDRFNAGVVRGANGAAGFGDCDQVSEVAEETDTETIKKQVTPKPCNMECTVKVDKPVVYGDAGGAELLAEIEAQTTGYTFQNGHSGYQSGHQGGYRPGEYSGARTGLGETTGTFSSSERPRGHYYNSSNLSRKERKRLKREGKLSAQRGGTFGTDYSGERHRVGQDDDGTLLVSHHKSAAVSKMGTFKLCELCKDDSTARETLYLRQGAKHDYEVWLCADCYDYWVEAEGDEVGDDDLTLPVATTPLGGFDRTKYVHPFEGVTRHNYCVAIDEDAKVCGRVEGWHVRPAVGERGGERCTSTRLLLSVCRCVNHQSALTEREARSPKLRVVGLLSPAPTMH